MNHHIRYTRKSYTKLLRRSKHYLFIGETDEILKLLLLLICAKTLKALKKLIQNSQSRLKRFGYTV